MLKLDGVSVRYPGAEAWAVDDVSLAFEPSVHTAILGPNGAGKSTLLRVIAGLLPCDRGSAALGESQIGAWSRRELARKMALVSSAEEVGFPVRLTDYVGLGRNPYLGALDAPGAADRRVVASALARTDLAGLGQRYVTQLSAGELQRARVARALAQEPELLLLDEPTAHLDLGHEFAVFDLLSQLVKELSLTIISVTHNINMASRFCSRVVLLRSGSVVADGGPAEVLTPEHLAAAYAWPVEVLSTERLGSVALPVSP